MSTTVWLSAFALNYPYGGGHLWVYLNWALGLREAGCKVVWLEAVDLAQPVQETERLTRLLRERLRPHGFADAIALCAPDGSELPDRLTRGCVPLELAAEADLLLNLRYATHPGVLGRFRRTALLDIDPGLLQLWVSRGEIALHPHDICFTIGETVGKPGSPIPYLGVTWHHTPPAVSLSAWPVAPAGPDAAFTTVSHWDAREWIEGAPGEFYCNNKRAGFVPFLDLPRLTRHPLELALCLCDHDEPDRKDLRARGWRVVHAYDACGTPDDYRRYVQQSLGELACCKPSCVRLQNAWISDRTLCYLASGKPAVVQHTGPSELLPDGAGLFRFSTPQQAAACIDRVMADYPRQSRLARQLAEECFDARKVATRLLERALGARPRRADPAIAGVTP
jgi:hypothetical protein